MFVWIGPLYCICLLFFGSCQKIQTQLSSFQSHCFSSHIFVLNCWVFRLNNTQPCCVFVLSSSLKGTLVCVHYFHKLFQHVSSNTCDHSYKEALVWTKTNVLPRLKPSWNLIFYRLCPSKPFPEQSTCFCVCERDLRVWHKTSVFSLACTFVCPVFFLYMCVAVCNYWMLQT